MSPHANTDRLLFLQLFRSYYDLHKHTSNPVVLGQFVELCVREALSRRTLPLLEQLHKYTGLCLGTGSIYDDGPSRKGQCDLLVYEGEPLFSSKEILQLDLRPAAVSRQEGATPFSGELPALPLVIVRPESVRAIVEVKSTLSSAPELCEALGQVEYLTGMAKQQLIVHLFIRNCRLSCSTVEKELYSWVKAHGSLSPRAVILFERLWSWTVKGSEKRGWTIEPRGPEEFEGLSERDRGLHIKQLREMSVEEMEGYMERLRVEAAGRRAPQLEHYRTELRKLGLALEEGDYTTTYSFFTGPIVEDLKARIGNW